MNQWIDPAIFFGRKIDPFYKEFLNRFNGLHPHCNYNATQKCSNILISFRGKRCDFNR